MTEPRERWSIAIDKDYLKFSAAHFLIFPDGSAERLHGHNYKVYVTIETELDRLKRELRYRTEDRDAARRDAAALQRGATEAEQRLAPAEAKGAEGIRARERLRRATIQA